MHGFWIFWIVALVFWSTTARRRWAWRRWEMMGSPMWYGGGRWSAYEGPWRRGPRGRGAPPSMPMRREPSDEEASHVEALETRIAELEQRLDFTERLLAGRAEKEQR